jgi:hypothetical protein
VRIVRPSTVVLALALVAGAVLAGADDAIATVAAVVAVVVVVIGRIGFFTADAVVEPAPASAVSGSVLGFVTAIALGVVSGAGVLDAPGIGDEAAAVVAADATIPDTGGDGVRDIAQITPPIPSAASAAIPT